MGDKQQSSTTTSESALPEEDTRELIAGIVMGAVGLLTGGIGPPVLAAAGATLSLKGWVDGRGKDAALQDANDLKDVIFLHADATRFQEAKKIIPIWQGSPRDNTALYGQVLQKGGTGWIDVHTGKAYWHPSDSFQCKRCQYSLVRSGVKTGSLSDRVSQRRGSQ